MRTVNWLRQQNCIFVFDLLPGITPLLLFVKLTYSLISHVENWCKIPQWPSRPSCKSSLHFWLSLSTVQQSLCNLATFFLKNATLWSQLLIFWFTINELQNLIRAFHVVYTLNAWALCFLWIHVKIKNIQKNWKDEKHHRNIYMLFKFWYSFALLEYFRRLLRHVDVL